MVLICGKNFHERLMVNDPISAAEWLAIARCPVSGQRLLVEGDALVTADGRRRYGRFEGIPDLRRSPARFKIDLPWYEPWSDLESQTFVFPEPLEAPDLPFHLDAHQAAIAGPEGRGRWILEIGCATRHAERYFTSRGFRYVGTDYDKRGRGPHLFADAHNLPFVDESFDLVYAMAVLEHLVSPLTAAAEAARILRAGGTFFGSAAFVYGFHDKASFNHMSSGGLLCMLRTVGFDDVQIWPGWPYQESIPAWAFRGLSGAPWRLVTRSLLSLGEWSYTAVSNVARRLAGKPQINILERRAHCCGGLNFAARKSSRRA